MAKAISEEKKAMMRDLAGAGHTVREIANLCGVSMGTVTIYAGGGYAGKKISKDSAKQRFTEVWIREFSRQWEEMRKLFGKSG